MKSSLSLKQKKVYLVFTVFIGILILIGCRDDSRSQNPTLMVKNEVTDNAFITAVKLTGYDFSSLNITKGNSQSFLLDKGMSGGYENINVQVFYKRTTATPVSSKNVSVNFQQTGTTTVTLKGCNSYEGCTGHTLE